MRPFFLLITACLAITGAASDNERVEVKSGENATLRVEKPGLGNASLVTLQKNCENGTVDEIYCSPEEEKSGCTAKKPERFSFMMDGGSFSVILFGVRASDEGCYMVSHVDFANIVTAKKFIVKVHEPVTESEAPGPSQYPTPNVAEDVSREPVTESEAAVPSQDPPNVVEDVSQEQLPSTINPEPQSIHPFTTPAISTKGNETIDTNATVTTVSTERNRKITGGFIGGLLGLIAAIVVTGIICCKKKKQNNHTADEDAEDPREGTPLNSGTNGVQSSR